MSIVIYLLSVSHIYLVIYFIICLFIYLSVIIGYNNKVRQPLLCRKQGFTTCLLCRTLQGHTTVDSNNDGGPQFAEVFVVVWVGSFIITMNSKLLGGTM